MPLVLDQPHHCSIASELVDQTIDNDEWYGFLVDFCGNDKAVAREITFGLALDAPDGFEIDNVELRRPVAVCAFSDKAAAVLATLVQREYDRALSTKPEPGETRLSCFTEFYCQYTESGAGDTALARAFLAQFGITAGL